MESSLAETRRGKIARMLKVTDMSPSEISSAIGEKVSYVVDDLVHISRSRKYGFMMVLPARCLKCGYVFKPEIKVPKRCPRCKSTWISEPRFKLV